MYKVSLHIIIRNIAMNIDDHTAFMIANSEILKFNDFDLAVYKRAGKQQKFRCVNSIKKDEPEESKLLPLTFCDDLTKHLIQVNCNENDTVILTCTSNINMVQKKSVVCKNTKVLIIPYSNIQCKRA